MSREDFDQLEDLGHDVAIQRMHVEGKLEGLAYDRGERLASDF